MLSVDAAARRAPAETATMLSAAQPSYRAEPSYHYVVSAAADPGLLPRALELLAKRGMVPRECHAVTRTPNDPGRPERMTVELRVTGLESMAANHVAACLRQLFSVDSVVFFETAGTGAA